MISTEQGLGLMGEIRNTISPLGGDDLPEWANQQYDEEPKLSPLVRRDQLWYRQLFKHPNPSCTLSLSVKNNPFVIRTYHGSPMPCTELVDA